MEKIGPATLIRDLLREHPEIRKVLAHRGMRCTACRGSENETVRNAAQNHGVPLPDLLHDLKAALKSGS